MKPLMRSPSETNWVLTPNWISSRVVTNKKIPALEQMGLKYKVTVRTRAGQVSNTDRYGPFASNDFVSVDIYGISQSQCENLRSFFSGGRSRLRCSETPQDYAISDFLDPAIQAAMNTVEQTREDEVPGRVLDLPTPGENCWALAYEIARLAQTKTPDFYTWQASEETGSQLWNMFSKDGYAKNIAEAQEMLAWKMRLQAKWPLIAEEIKNAPAENDKYNRPGFIFGVVEKYAGKMPDPSENENLQPGDILIVGESENVAHAAIFIAPGIYFERTQGNTRRFGGGNRLVFSDEIVRMYTVGMYSHWRPVRSLPLPQEAFYYNNGAAVSSKQHTILFDERGIAYFSGALSTVRQY